MGVYRNFRGLQSNLENDSNGDFHVNLKRTRHKGFFKPSGRFQRTWTFPHPETHALINSIEKVTQLEDWEIPVLKDTPFQNELFRLKETLLWWSQTTENHIGNPLGILRENLLRGADFADEVADTIAYSLREVASVGLPYGGADWPQTYHIESIDQIFSPKHLLPFTRGESEDFEYLFKDYSKIGTDLISNFKDKVREFIVHPIENKRELDDFDLLHLAGSRTNLGENFKRLPKSLLKASDRGSLKCADRFLFDSCTVYKEPHESRACVIPTPETLNALTLLELQMEQVLRVPSDSYRDHDFSWVPDYLSGNSHWIFFMSDQKKCGLTFPMQLLLALFEVLEETFPTWDFGLMRGYKDAYVKHNNSLRKIQGGPGLGMMNGAVSAASAILFELWKDSLDSELRVDGRFFNDDQVIRINATRFGRIDPHPDLIDTARSWDMFMESYGLLIHRKKPFLARGGLFLETYGELFGVETTKRCKKLGNLFHALTCVNITHAKEYVKAVFDSLDTNLLEEGQLILSKIISHWGYEFSPDEVNLPFEIGGWVSSSRNGANDLFNDIEALCSTYYPFLRIFGVKKNHGPQDKRVKENNSAYSRVSKAIKKELDSSRKLPSKYSYYSMMDACFRLEDTGSRATLQVYQNWHNRRITKFKDKSLKLWPADISLKYWDYIIENDGNYNPPHSYWQEKGEILPFLPDLKWEEPPHPKGSTIRGIFKILQNRGELQNLKFWYPYSYEDEIHLWYDLLTTFERQMQVRLSAKGLLQAICVGSDKIKKILDQSLLFFGEYRFPKIPTPLDSVFTGFWGVEPTEDIYFLEDQSSRFVYPIDNKEIPPDLIAWQWEYVGRCLERRQTELLGEVLLPYTDSEEIRKIFQEDLPDFIRVVKPELKSKTEEPPPELLDSLGYLKWQVEGVAAHAGMSGDYSESRSQAINVLSSDTYVSAFDSDGEDSEGLGGLLDFL